MEPTSAPRPKVQRTPIAPASPGVISSFRGAAAELSNFFPVDVVLDGATYPSVEHAFQAAKTSDVADREAIRKMASAFDAKSYGQKVRLHASWEDVKDGVMLDLVRQKFRQPSLRGRLVATGEQELIEGNTWGDTYWGVCNGKGQNRLGRILMRVRGEILSGSLPAIPPKKILPVISVPPSHAHPRRRGDAASVDFPLPNVEGYAGLTIHASELFPNALFWYPATRDRVYAVPPSSAVARMKQSLAQETQALTGRDQTLAYELAKDPDSVVVIRLGWGYSEGSQWEVREWIVLPGSTLLRILV